MTPTINSEDTVLAAAELRVRSLVEGLKDLRSYLNLEAKNTRLLEIEKELESPQAWSERERMTELTREKNSLTGWIQQEAQLAQGVGDCSELIEILSTEEDSELIAELQEKLADCEAAITDLEVRQLFSGEADSLDCFLNIQSGSGGTEAQDWADMLLRMYLRWVEKRGFNADVQDKTLGEVAGIKSASIAISGDCAYGLLRTETGVHRLVRKSPFDSGSRRHTSFASVFVTPQLDETIEVEIDWSDVRVDTYRASGAGGQHINKTDSAVRMTHLPTKLVVQCQSERSQHQNREKCVKQLEAGLYELELRRRNAEKQKLEDSKTDIGWGQQIRSYVLDQSRIKDLRTGTEVTNTVAVLDGDLDPFILASLKQGL